MAENIGYGNQTPTSSASDFNKVSFLVQQMIARLNTMKLVQVKAVTAGEGDGDVKAAGTVDVLPLVNQIDGEGNANPHVTVFGIPWTRAQGGKNAVVVDPEVGDIGYVVCSDRDISAVKSSKKQSNPGSRRKYSLSDGVYVGGVLNVAPEQYLVFTADGVRLADKAGNVLKLSSAGIELTPKSGTPVKVNGDLVVTGNIGLGGTLKDQAVTGEYGGDIATTGDVTAGSISLKTHVHSYDRPTGTSAPADTGQPT